MIDWFQESGHKTIDIVRIHEAVLMDPSCSESDAKLRLQCRQLLSDMEAFKAANPLCCFEDFVGWYSPKDWNMENKTMSARMSDESNAWHKTWNAAKSIPAGKQLPLFDQHLEAERVISLFFLAIFLCLTDCSVYSIWRILHWPIYLFKPYH